MQIHTNLSRAWNILLFILLAHFPFSELLSRSSQRRYEVELKVVKGRIEYALSEFRKEYKRLPTESEGLSILVGCEQPLDCSRYRPMAFLDKRYLLDPWRNKFLYKLRPDGTAEVFSLGEDGKIGGKDYDADIDILHSDLDNLGPIDYRSLFDKIFMYILSILLIAIPITLIKAYVSISQKLWRIFFVLTLSVYIFSIIHICTMVIRD